MNEPSDLQGKVNVARSQLAAGEGVVSVFEELRGQEISKTWAIQIIAMATGATRYDIIEILLKDTRERGEA